MSEFSPERSDAIRAELRRTVATMPSPRRTAHRWLPGVALLVIGIVTGGAVSAAAVTGLQQGGASSEAFVDAPPGVVPGQPIISLLGQSTAIEAHGSQVIELPPRPDGATHVRVTFTCLTAGVFTWGTDSSGNNPSTACGTSDVDSDTATGWQDSPVRDGSQFYSSAETDQRSLYVFQYLNFVPTALGTNDSGKTFGAATDGREPDLIAVIGLNSEGAEVSGFAFATELDAFGPDWPRQPRNPEEALAWQTERDARYPRGWEIPVYLSDGTTKVGTFHIGG